MYYSQTGFLDWYECTINLVINLSLDIGSSRLTMVAHWKKILLPSCLYVSISNGYTNPPDPRVFDNGDIYRLAAPGRKRTIPWPSADPVPSTRRYNCSCWGSLLHKGKFGPLHGSRAIEVELECAELGIDLDQALSIRRKQLVTGKVLKGGASKLKDQCTIKRIRKEFEQRQRLLLDISQAYDLPPVSIFRAILAPRVLNAYPQFTCLDRSRPTGRIIQSIISGNDPDLLREFLSQWEVNELKVAMETWSGTAAAIARPPWSGRGRYMTSWTGTG